MPAKVRDSEQCAPKGRCWVEWRKNGDSRGFPCGVQPRGEVGIGCTVMLACGGLPEHLFAHFCECIKYHIACVLDDVVPL